MPRSGCHNLRLQGQRVSYTRDLPGTCCPGNTASARSVVARTSEYEASSRFAGVSGGKARVEFGARGECIARAHEEVRHRRRCHRPRSARRAVPRASAGRTASGTTRQRRPRSRSRRRAAYFAPQARAAPRRSSHWWRPDGARRRARRRRQARHRSRRPRHCRRAAPEPRPSNRCRSPRSSTLSSVGSIAASCTSLAKGAGADSQRPGAPASAAARRYRQGRADRQARTLARHLAHRGQQPTVGHRRRPQLIVHHGLAGALVVGHGPAEACSPCIAPRIQRGKPPAPRYLTISTGTLLRLSTSAAWLPSSRRRGRAP